jgi:hypothetical protein
MAENKNSDKGEQLLLAEFHALYERAKSFEEIKAGRVNFFLFIVGAIGAGFSAATQVKLVQDNIYYFVISIAGILFLVGLTTLKHSVEYSMAIVSLFRRAGRVRRWFLEKNSRITPYLAFHAADDRPKMELPISGLTWRGAEPIVVILNAVLGVIFIATIIFQIIQLKIIALLVGSTVVSVLIWFLQLQYVRHKLRKAEGHTRKGPGSINFPFDDQEYISSLPKTSRK